MTYPYSDCCPNLPSADPGCDDGWCCTHETWHETEKSPPMPEPQSDLVAFIAERLDREQGDLRELPLKRRLLDEHRPRSIVDPDDKEREDWPERVCRICDPRWMGTPDWEQDEDFVPPEPEYCEYLRMLGSIWSDSPDFRPEWLIEESSTDA